MKHPPSPVVYFSLALSIVTLGDSLLYVLLPSYYPQLGLAPIQVGILLSINRWVRLFTNHLAEYCFRRYPSPLWVIFAFLIGSVVAVIYGITNLFVVFFVARILWGVSFSFLRQAGVMTAVHSGADVHLGERMGYFRGINAMFRTLGVFLGGVCHDMFGFAATLVSIGLLSLAAAPLGYLSQKSISRIPKALSQKMISKGHMGIMFSGFTLGIVGPGMIISTLGLVLKTQIGESFIIFNYTVGVATLTSFILGWRWFIDGIGSPILGAAADRIGRQRSLRFLFPLNTVMLLMASVQAKPIFLILFLFIIFICTTALMTLLSVRAGQNGPRSVALYATAMDFGMSVGPLIGWGIAQFGLLPNYIFLWGAVIYMVSSIVALRTFGHP
ncbi:MAG: hypothetical protein JRI77_00345 [Deltaproteobacteria bacterium]|nr:hypothetical protein [Deltaproteobacteria bacterium]